MSVKALNAVFEESRATGRAFVVHLALADWADHNGYCYPSYAQIARKARVSRRMVVYALEQLQALGELEVSIRGHAPSAQDSDDPDQVRRQHRNLYRLVLLRPKRKVVQPVHHLDAPPSDDTTGGEPVQPLHHFADAVDTDDEASEVVQPMHHLSPPLPILEVVQSQQGGGATSVDQVVQNEHAHIRNKPSGDPSVDPSATAAADEPVAGRVFNGGPQLDCTNPADGLAISWNRYTSGTPLKPCLTMTAKRRRLARARLAERPLIDWGGIIARLARSSFCCGENRTGFQASFDWLIGSPDPAVKVLEGQYDDHYSETELAAAKSSLAKLLGVCPHTPSCEYREDCIEREARRLRAARRVAS